MFWSLKTKHKIFRKFIKWVEYQMFIWLLQTIDITILRTISDMVGDGFDDVEDFVVLFFCKQPFFSQVIENCQKNQVTQIVEKSSYNEMYT